AYLTLAITWLERHGSGWRRCHYVRESAAPRGARSASRAAWDPVQPVLLGSQRLPHLSGRARACSRVLSRQRHGLGVPAAASLVPIALLAGTARALHGVAQARVEAGKAAQVADFVRSILAGIDPNRAMGLDRSLMRLVLDSAAERASRELADQPDVQAMIEDTIANSYSSLGEYGDAATHFTAAADAARRAVMPAAQVARFEIDAATNRNSSGHAKQALDAAQQAFERVAGLSPDDRDRLYVESLLATIESGAGRLAEARERL